MSKLDLALPSISPMVASSSLVQARARLGPEPMEWLFTSCAERWAHASARSRPGRGLALYGVDGTRISFVAALRSTCGISAPRSRR